MADASFIQPSFLAGEWSKTAQGRVDRPEYRTAMNVCLNGFPIETGAAPRRPGFRHTHHTRAGAAGRLIKFDFKAVAPYNIEFTDNFIRPHAGPDLATLNDDQVVVSISSANPAKVATTTAHGWASLKHVFFKDLGVHNPLLQNRQFSITVTSVTEFTLQDAITGANIDGLTLGTFVSGTVSGIVDIVSPYAAGSWSSVRAVQEGKQSVLLHPTVKPQILAVDTDPTADEFATFTLTPENFKDGPYYDPVAGGALVTPSGLTGNVTLTISFTAYDATKSYSIGDYVTSGAVNYKSLTDGNINNTPVGSPSNWVAVSAGVAVGPDGFIGTDFGRLIRLYSEPAEWAVGSTYAIRDVVTYNGVSYANLVAGSIGRIPGLNPTDWSITTTGSRWTWGKITGFATMISRTLAGAVHIGNLTTAGGLAAAYDGNVLKVYTSCAFLAAATGYVGQNYTAAAAQAIGSGTVWPSTDAGFLHVNTPIEIQLRASNVAPTFAALNQGTLLGTTGSISDTKSPITITSTDQVSTWNYVWFQFNSPNGTDLGVAVAQAQFFNPSGTGTSGNGCTVQLLGDPLLYTTPIRTWRLGLYSDTTGWPSCGCYHEGRLWLSGVVDNRIDSSKSNDLYNFAPTAPDGTVAGSNGISYTFNARDVNSIYWMKSDQQGILCGTIAGEWLVQATSQNLSLTPTTMQAHRVTRIGCANIEPAQCEHTTAFVQRYGRKVMEYFADVYSGKFSAPNLARDAKHLTAGNIAEIAYQQELTPILWMRRDDGALVGATYKRDSLLSSQGPSFIGWHRHTLGSGRDVESICVGPSQDGDLDSLAIVSNDPDTDIRHVEILTDLQDEDAPLTDAWHLDNAITPSSYEYSTSGPVTSLLLHGLWHLNGETVSLWLGGLDMGDFAVASGTITIPLPATDGTGKVTVTTDYIDGFGAGACPIVVGFTYTTDGQIVRPATREDSGTRNGPAFGKKRRLHQLGALLQRTQGISFGTSFDAGRLRPAVFQTNGGTAYSPLQVFSGTLQDVADDDESLDGMLCWRITRPYPATVVCIGGYLHTSDR